MAGAFWWVLIHRRANLFSPEEHGRDRYSSTVLNYSDNHETDNFLNIWAKADEGDVRTPKGAKASAIYYSLIETAKANGWVPYEYFQIVLKKLPYAETVENIEALLPWNLKNPKTVRQSSTLIYWRSGRCWRLCSPGRYYCH